MKIKKITAFAAAMALVFSCGYGALPESTGNLISAVDTESGAAGSGIDISYSPYSYRMINIGSEWYDYISIDKITCSSFADEITVPSEDEGNRLFVLGKGCIENKKLKNIYVSEGIMELEDMAISGCSSLECLTLPDSVVKAGRLELGEGVSIRGSIGSYAEKYAFDNGYSFDGITDINGDHAVNASDILSLTAYMYGADNFDEGMKRRADANTDSCINIVDFIRLKQNVIEPPMSVLGASNDDVLAVPDLNNISEGFVDSEGLKEFTADLAVNLLGNPSEENYVFSPLSIYMALSMAADCAAGETQDEMVSALHSGNISSLREDNNKLFGALYHDDYTSYLKLTNSLWLNKKYEFYQDKLESIADNFYAYSFAREFSVKTQKEISDWIFKNTSGKINPSIEISKDAVMEILNTVTFKEKWAEKFSDATPDNFYLSDGTEISCDFLHMSTEQPTEKIGFADNYMKYDVLMDNGYKMNFILPDEGTDISDIVSDRDTMLEIINDDISYETRKIVFSVPKFDISSKYKLNDAVKQMGVKLAFDSDLADFSGVVDFEKSGIQSAYIEKIIHEATIAIDEEGCEAAAYTIIELCAGAAPPSDEEPVYFELNRPFFCYVSDQAGNPVFSAVISNPVLK